MDPRKRWSINRLRRRQHALFGHEALQLARLVHLADDVAAADEFAFDVELGNGGPVGEGLDALAQAVVLQTLRLGRWRCIRQVAIDARAAGDQQAGGVQYGSHGDHFRVGEGPKPAPLADIVKLATA